MGGYRCALALDALLGEINTRAPHRDKSSDGWIGDAAHQSRESDHNPWVRLGSTGIVTARDFDHDPEHGADMADIAETIRRRRDPRVKYVIHAGRMFRSYPKPEAGLAAWEWGTYKGANAHRHHMHVSVLPTRSAYDDTRRWLDTPAKPGVPAVKPQPAGEVARTLRVGMSGLDVAVVQRFIGGVKADGVFGERTRRAVIAYQIMRGISADGVVGPETWRHIRGQAGK